MDTQINGLLQRNTMTNTWWLLRVCIVVAAGVGLASCTKEQTTQVLTQPAETIQPLSPCFPAGVATTGTPEFCVNVTEIQPSNHETHVDIGLSLMNRTGHRLYITVIGPTTLTDSSGRTWNTGESMGFGGLNTPVPIEPDGRTQGAISFHRQEQILPGTTFSLHGEIGIMKMDSRGQVVPGEIAIKRGIHLSDIRIQQQPPRSIGTKKQDKNTKSAQASPRQATPKRPKPSTSSKSSVPGPVVDASGRGKANSQKLASVNASRSPDRALSTIDSSAAGAVTRKTASKFIGNGGSGPDVIGLRIGMTPNQARAKFKSHGFGSSTKSPNRPFDSYTESSNTLTYSLPGQAPRPVPNTGYVAQISGVISDIKVPVTENSGDVLTIFFGPVPGQGGIVLLNRTEYIPASKRPTIAAFAKILIGKYGTPTELLPDSPGIYRWRYDDRGTLRKPSPATNFAGCPRLKPGVVAFQSPGSPATIQEYKQSVPRCGATFLEVDVGFADFKYAGPGTLIKNYTTHMTGLDAAVRALDAAKEIVEKAQEEAGGAAIKKGQQHKSDL